MVARNEIERHGDHDRDRERSGCPVWRGGPGRARHVFLHGAQLLCPGPRDGWLGCRQRQRKGLVVPAHDPNGEVDVPDAGYLSFGWWLGEDGEDYVFDAFAIAHGDDLPAGYSESADNVEGTATYRGAAAGNYAMRSVTEDSASAGHFTASVVLAADFDYDDPATTGTDEDDFMLSGTIFGLQVGWHEPEQLGRGAEPGFRDAASRVVHHWRHGDMVDGRCPQRHGFMERPAPWRSGG